MKDQLEFKRRNWDSFAMRAMSMKILKPDKAAELNIDDLAWQGMKQRLEVFREKDWRQDFIRQAMYMRIICPDKFAELNIDDADWQGMKKVLEKSYRGRNWPFYAMCLKILAADKVGVTDQGLEITMRPPESFKSEKKPRPERKNF